MGNDDLVALQKRMERETGAKIAIRGKGSVKEGRGPVNRRGEPLHDPSSDNDDLHVVITADTEEAVEKVGRAATGCWSPLAKSGCALQRDSTGHALVKVWVQVCIEACCTATRMLAWIGWSDAATPEEGQTQTRTLAYRQCAKMRY